MTAKEMFEKLGFYEDKNHFSTMAIIVYRNEKYEYSLYFDYDKTIDIECVVSLDLLQAINQQVKELGWYE